MAGNIKLTTEADFKNAEQALNHLDRSVQELEKTAAKGAGFKAFGLTLTDIKSGIDMAAKAAQTAARVIEQAWELTGGATVKYAEQVRDLGRISGQTAEESSRLIQVADDLKIEFGTLKQAAKALADDGITLTIDALAKASDEYRKFGTAGEKAEYANKMFGRSAQEITKFLELGGAALKKLAAEQNTNLILTKKQVDEARNFELAEDAFADSVKGVEISIGSWLLPALTKGINYFNRFGESAEESAAKQQAAADKIAAGASLLSDHYDDLVKINVSWFNKNQETTMSAIGVMTAQEKEIGKAQQLWVDYAKSLTASTGKTAYLTEGMADLATSIIEANAGWAANSSAVKIWSQETETYYQAAEEEARKSFTSISEQAEKNKKVFEDLKFSVGGSVGKMIDTFAENKTKLQAEIAGYETEIAKLKAGPYPNLGKLDELNTKLGESKSKLQELSKEFEITAKKMVFDMLVAKASIDGITDTEFANLMTVAQGMGIVDQKSKDMADAINAMDLTNGKLELEDVLNVLNRIFGLPSGKTFTFTTINTEYNFKHYKEVENQPLPKTYYPGGEEYASGGSFVVPPGYEDHSWPVGPGMWGQSGEQITISPRGSASRTDRLLTEISEKLDSSGIDERRLARALRDALMQVMG